MAPRSEVLEKFGPKSMEAFGLAAHKENNLLRGWITQFKAAVAAAFSLSDLQTRIAALPNMPERSVQQLLEAVNIDIDGSSNYDWPESEVSVETSAASESSESSESPGIFKKIWNILTMPL